MYDERELFLLNPLVLSERCVWVIIPIGSALHGLVPVAIHLARRGVVVRWVRVDLMIAQVSASRVGGWVTHTA